MKRILYTVIFILLMVCPVLADYTVDSVAVSADVTDRGQAQVTATVQLTFDAVTEQVTIPLPERSVSNLSAGNFRFSREDTDAGVNAVIKNKNGFAGIQTFQISYTVPYPGASDEYTLGILSSRWEKPVGACSFQVNMPKTLENAPRILSGYHGALSESEAGLTYTTTGVSGTLGARMAYDSLSMAVELPEGYFNVRSATLPVVSVTFLAVGMGLVLLLAVGYWRLKLRSDHGEVNPRLLLPEGILSCQLPMLLDGASCDMAALILEWANMGYLSITRSLRGTVVLTKLMSMGSERSRAEQRLFLRIFGRKLRVAAAPGRFSGAGRRFQAAMRRSFRRVSLDPRGGNPVFVQLPCRILLAVAVGAAAYRLMPGGAGFVVLAVLAGIAGFVCSVFLHSSLSALAAHHRLTWQVLISLALVAGLLALSLVSGALPEMAVGLIAVAFSAIATASGPRRNSRGVDAMAQAKGLRVFYRDVAWQRLQVYQGRDSRFFETQLPRAAALGVDRRFAARFERLSVPMPEWLELPREADRSARSLQRQLAPILRQLRAAFS